MTSIRLLFFLFASALVFVGAHLSAESPPPEAAEEVNRDEVKSSDDATKKTPLPDAEATTPLKSNEGGELRDLTAPSANEIGGKNQVEVEERSKRKVKVPRVGQRSRGSRQITGLGDAYLPAGETAGVLVAVFGDAQANGPVKEAVVAIFGDSEAKDDVGQAVVAVFGDATAEKSVGESVVAVMGDARANGHVREEVVSVFGTIWLGPNAVIDGDVVSVGGKVERDPSAVIHGEITEVPFVRHIPMLGTLGLWFKETIAKGRLLALDHRLVWPWALAFSFLGFYCVLALAIGPTLTRCADTLDERPLKTFFAALLSLVVAPALIVVLLITLIGAAAVFFAVLAALLVGKAAFLAWLGRRFSNALGISHVALSVLLGGVLLLVLYTLPVIGLLVWMMGSTLGLGMAIYTVILTSRRDRAARALTGEVRTGSPFVAPAATAAVPSAAPSFSASSASGSPIPPLPETPPRAPFGSTAGAAVPPLAAIPFSSIGLPRAGFWIRLAASLLDLILVAVVAGGILHLGDLLLLLLTLYTVVMWAKKGTTLGGVICGLKVVRLDDRPLDWTVAIVRALGAFLSFCVVGLGFIWVAFDENKQSWHDKIAGTTVVRVPKGVSLI